VIKKEWLFMNGIIKIISFKDIKSSALYKDAKRHKLLMSEKLKYFGWYDNDVLIAFNGYKIRGKIIHLDCAYCEPEHRRKGIYTKLHWYRMNHIKENTDIKKARVTCTKYSRGLHIKSGAKLIHTFPVSKWEKYEYTL
tara:strand:+ start:7071 stop:7484 length:414 start_codon:yes stop_codon:yes gene_type:complete